MALAVAFAVTVVVIVPGLPGDQGGPPIVSTPNDNADVNGAPDFQTMLPAGGGTLIEGVGNGYWCTRSSCGGGPSLAAWTTSPFVSVAGGALPDGTPVLAGLTEVRGGNLRLSLLTCTRRACTLVGGGAFTAPGFGSAGETDPVYAASADRAGFAVAFGGYHANGAESLYVVVCDSAACQRPRATRLGTGPEGALTGSPVSGVVVAAAPDGGFAAALKDPRTGHIDVYQCAAAPCRAVTERQVAAFPAGAIAITVTSSGQALLAYDAGLFTGFSDSQVVLAGAEPGGSFRQLAAVNAPISGVSPDGNPGAWPAPYPAIAFAGPDLVVVSEDPAGHAVTLTACAIASCGNATKVTKVADVGHPIVALGIGVPAGAQRIFWATQDTDVLGAIHYSGHLWIGNQTYP
jgi:hypothetical protein